LAKIVKGEEVDGANNELAHHTCLASEEDEHESNDNPGVSFTHRQYNMEMYQNLQNK
jgi:hypothetical protein